MKCPYCGNVEDRVVDSRLADEGLSIRRRRQCESCARRYTTFERLEEIPLLVLKRSGAVEPYSREKVLAGVRKAFQKRPATEEDLQNLADDLEEFLRENHPREAASREIGRWILGRLRAMDEVAYLRFASVYKGFQDASEFDREIGYLLEKKSPPKSRQMEEVAEWRP